MLKWTADLPEVKNDIVNQVLVLEESFFGLMKDLQTLGYETAEWTMYHTYQT